MRTVFRPIAVLLLLFSLLIGCGPKAPQAVKVAVFSSDPVLLKIFMDTALEIEKKHPGLKVQVVNIPYGDYQNKIITEMAGGTAPDIISVEVNNFVEMEMRGVFEDLTPYAQRDGLDLKAYYPGVLKRFNPGGVLYAIPSDTAPSGLMYYNKKIFDEVGLPYPTSSWTWPEPFLSICQKLTKRDAAGKIVRWGYADPYGTGFDGFLLSNGGYYTDSEDHPTRLALDSPEALEALKFRRDMIHVHHVSPSPPELLTYSFGGGAEDMFMNGQVAMMASGIWHTPHLLQKKDLEFDVVEFPMGPKGTRGCGTGGSGYSICKTSKNKELAWTVLKEITGKDIVTRMAMTGMFQPALMEVANSDAFLKSPGPPNKKILLDMPQYAHYSPFMRGWSEIWNGNVGPALDPVWLGTKTPEEVLPALSNEINKKFFSKPE